MELGGRVDSAVGEDEGDAVGGISVGVSVGSAGSVRVIEGAGGVDSPRAGRRPGFSSVERATRFTRLRISKTRMMVRVGFGEVFFMYK